MLTGWRSRSVSVLNSRIDIVRELASTTTPQEVFGYLRAGVSSIREVPKFIKAGLDAETVQRAFDIGVTSPTVIGKFVKNGIDFSMMDTLLNHSL